MGHPKVCLPDPTMVSRQRGAASGVEIYLALTGGRPWADGLPSPWRVPICRRRPDGKWRRQLAGSKTYSAAGWGLFAVGNVARFVSMRFAAQTVLSGLGSLQFVVIPIASRWLLGIKPTAATVMGLAVVLLGEC